MDISLLTGLAGSLKATYELGTAALAVRDANQIAVTVAEMNAKLLDAQQSLFHLGTQTMAMQKELADSQELVRQLQYKVSERDRYRLAEVCFGNFAYESRPSDAGGSEPSHYVCQPCFDNGRKSVLRYRLGANHSAYLDCPSCPASIQTAAPHA